MPDWFASNGITTVQQPTSGASGGNWFASNGISTVESSQPAPAKQRDSLDRLGEEFWKRANPIEWAKGLYHAAHGANALDIIKADPAFLTQAEDEWKKGNHLTAARKVLSYLSMGLGHDLDAQAEMIDKGDIAGSIGAMGGTATSFLAPEAIAKGALVVKGAVAPVTRMTPANPAIADAVAFGQRSGVPLDAATATDNAAIRGTQHIADRTLGGAQIAGKATQAQQAGLATLGEQLAAKAHPSPVTPESAGQAIQGRLAKTMATLDERADTAYQQANRLAAQRQVQVQVGTNTTNTGVLDAQGRPITRETPIMRTFETPTDLKAVKAGFEPLYQELAREAALVPLQGAKARAFVALDRLMKGPDVVSMMDAERATSDLGALAGHPDLPSLRNSGQGVAAKAFSDLRSAVDTTARQAGPDVYSALNRGRDAVKTKYTVQDLYDKIREEPVQAFKRATAPNDTTIQQLRDIQQHAPDELPKLGRAYLDSLLSKATESGGFQHADKLYADWQKLGPQTKEMLFQDPAYIKNLDRFFLLSKQMAKNANPSGTAHAAAIAAQGGQMLWSLFHGDIGGVGAGGASVAASAGMSSFLHSPAGVRLLTEGLVLPPSATARATWLARARKFAAAQGASVLAPRPTVAPAGSMQ